MEKLETVTDILRGQPQTLADYRNEFLMHLQRNQRDEKPQSEPLKAGIDCGRWVVNCECGGGIALHPAWQFAGCLTCGRSWTTIKFPSEEFMQRLDEVLSLRPRLKGRTSSFYSWWPEETLEDLYRDNLEHGWPIPSRMP